jgi:hypothetical protein
MVMVAAPILGMLPDDGGEPDGTGNSGGSGGGSVGPMADTTDPKFHSFSHSAKYPGPTSLVNVSALISDLSTPINVTVKYGTDNKTWTNLTTKSTSGLVTMNDRNPASGYVRGTTLSKTYDMKGVLAYLYVYCYSSDSDTMTINIQGWDPSSGASGAWVNIFSGTNQRNGAKVNTNLMSKGYTMWKISQVDTENNDNIYYNCTYKDVAPISFDIPGAGQKNKMYVHFNASDTAANCATYVYEYNIDLVKPGVKDMSKFGTIWRGQHPLEIHANVTDNGAVGVAYLNWSTDNSTWNLQCMTYVEGYESPIHFKSSIPVPSNNTTVYFHVEGYDVGSNHATGLKRNLTWNPPPLFTNINHDPYFVNNRTNVTVSAIVTDGDGVSKVYLRYSAICDPARHQQLLLRVLQILCQRHRERDQQHYHIQLCDRREVPTGIHIEY